MKALLAAVILTFSLNAHSQSSLTVKQWTEMYNNPATRQYAVEIYAVIAEVHLDRRRMMLCNKELLRTINAQAFTRYAESMQDQINMFRYRSGAISGGDKLMAMRMTQLGQHSAERAYPCGPID